MNITITDTELSLQQAAKTFVENMKDRKIFAFYGKMGAGKTTFIKAICEELGSKDVITSPTFSIVNEYQVLSSLLPPPSSTIFHFDFYRIKKLEEVYDMGYEEYFYSGALCLIEWPELIEEILPDDAVRVDIIEQEDGSRTITF